MSLSWTLRKSDTFSYVKEKVNSVKPKPKEVNGIFVRFDYIETYMKLVRV